MDEQVTPAPAETPATETTPATEPTGLVAEVEAVVTEVEAETVSLFARASEMAHNIVHHSFGRSSPDEPVVTTIINGSH